MLILNLGIGGNYSHTFVKPAEALVKEGYDIELGCFDYKDLNEDILKHDAFLRTLRTADFIFVQVHGDVTYYKRYDQFEKALRLSNIPVILFCNSDPDVTARHRDLFRYSDEDFKLLLTLLCTGGETNNRSALLWVLKNIAGIDVSVPDVIRPPAQGIYVPGKEGCIPLESITEFLSEDRLNICVIFHKTAWLNQNTKAIDYLCRCIADKGDNPVAVFCNGHYDPISGSIGIFDITERYFIRDGRSIFDCYIQTLGFSLTLKPVSGVATQPCKYNFLIDTDAPVIQAMTLYGSGLKWKESIFGLTGPEIAGAVIQPEYDGQIITVPYAGYDKDEVGKPSYEPIKERCPCIAETAHMWAALKHIPVQSKKVSILLYMYPPRADLAGGASGLDTMESVARLLKEMSAAGYHLDWVPEDGKEIVRRIVDDGLTNDTSWLSDEQIDGRSPDKVPKDLYRRWFDSLSEKCRTELVKGWGDPPGEILTLGKEQLIPGVINGNVFIGFQPDRGKTSCENYHSADDSPPHQYIGFYRWLKYVFHTDAVIHVGTHGSLEWLPGKSVGLSEDCFPDAVLDSIPNIYPYIIDNPGEGMQAKRRSYAVVTTHMIPSMTRAEGYGDLEELEDAVQQLMKAISYKETDKQPMIASEMLKIIGRMSAYTDFNLKEESSPEDVLAVADDIYDHVLEIKDALINDGLHILGDIPEGRRLSEMIYSLTRNDNGIIPSLRASIATSLGYDFDSLMQDPSFVTDGIPNGVKIDECDTRSIELIDELIALGFDKTKSLAHVSDRYPDNNSGILACVGFMCDTVVPGILGMGDEIGNVLHALDGGFVPPGPSGCPTRGRAEVLPMGRNFYSIDPDGIPWHSSWEIGKKMADAMVDRYVDEHGSYPRSIGIVVWATDTMRTGGDDISYVLWLMGLRPVWDGYGGRVIGLDVVPAAELGRPRLDVTMRVSGLFRDAFPNLMDMFDEAVGIIGSLDESEDVNYLAANLRQDIVEAIADGMTEDEARRAASVRVFSNAPGQYGCSVNTLISTKKWETVDDLGQAYIDYSCFGYGKGLSGQSFSKQFRKRMGSLNVTVKNHNNRECDLFDCDDDYDFLGGMNAAVRSVSGTKPMSFMGDSSDTRNLRTRTLEEETRFVFRSKINNPKWLKGLKVHGFKGVQELSTLFDYIIGWDSTSDSIEDWMYQSVTENFVFDEETREWIEEENPYALMAMLDRLNEAMERRFWDPDDETKERLREIFLEAEEIMEGVTDR